MSPRYDRKDHLYQRAKEEGLQSRAAYKLVELDKRYGLLKPGFKVLDLGAWPGGWMQIASRKVGADGLVVGIDLVPIDQVQGENVFAITGDVRDEEHLAVARDRAGGRFDLVLSDMSPKLTGIKEVDQAATVGVAELALWVCESMLRERGNFVVKVFKGNDTEVFIRSARPLFEKVVRSELKSTRKTSNEFYVVGLGYKRSS